jgi:hypothetical protein
MENTQKIFEEIYSDPEVVEIVELNRQLIYEQEEMLDE